MTKPKTPLIALQGGLVLSALRKKKKMSDDPFAWYPFAAESAPMPEDVTQETRLKSNVNDDQDNISMSGDSVPDHDLHPRIVLPPGLTLERKSRSSASVVSLGSWEPLDLIDLEPAESEESEEGDDSTVQKEEGADEHGSSSRNGAKTLASDDSRSRSSRVNVSYFASHVSVVIVMLSLTFLGSKRSSVNEPSLISIRGAVKQAVFPALPATVETTHALNVKAKLSNAMQHVARTGEAIFHNVEQQVKAVNVSATALAIKDGHHSVVSFLLNPSGQKDLPPFEVMNFVDSMMLL